jgi:hypothetical protein
MGECNETMQEFQGLIDLGAAADIKDGQQGQQVQQEEITWDDFLQGQSEQYSTIELPIATACVALVKCSRGSINVALKTCECVGEQAEKDTIIDKEQKNDMLNFISKLHDLARLVGEGMTDMGSLLYPPLELKVLDTAKDDIDHLAKQVLQQKDRIIGLLEFILDSCPAELDEDICEMATKLKAAATTRYQEAEMAIQIALQSK